MNEPVHEDIGVISKRFPAKEAGIQEMRERIVETGRSRTGGGEGERTEASGEEGVRGDSGFHVGGGVVVVVEEAGFPCGGGGI